MQRNFGLDLLRAISIWLVLLQHGGINIPGLNPLQIGGIGVEVFFVISGFLIGGILFREIDKGNSFTQTLKSFWIRRWFRILPLYYAVLLFKFLVIDHSIGANILYYVFFLQNNFYGNHFFAVSWSLVIEEWFYLFVPLFLWVAIKFLKTDAKVFSSMLIFIIGVNIIRMIYVYITNVPYVGINGNFPFRFDSLFMGVIFAFAKHKKWKLFDEGRGGLLFSIGILLCLGYLFYYWKLAYPNNLIDRRIFPRTIGFFLLPFSISLTLPYVSALKLNLKRNLFTKSFFFFVNTTSILTYSIYLIHPFIYGLGISFVFAIPVTYLVAWLVYTYFEKPILGFRDRITGYDLPKEKASQPEVVR